MSKPVKLEYLVGEMDGQFDEMPVFLNRKTGEVVSVTQEALAHAEEGTEEECSEPDEVEIAIEIVESDHFIQLPTQYDINEYNIMSDFCHQIEDARISNLLCNAIKESGAFRRFRENLQKFDIEKDWYQYKEGALREIAIGWCNANNIPYE